MLSHISQRPLLNKIYCSPNDINKPMMRKVSLACLLYRKTNLCQKPLSIFGKILQPQVSA